MADYITLAKPLQLSTPGTAPIAGLTVADTAALEAIDSPWLGMFVYVQADGKTYRVTGLKEISVGVFKRLAVASYEALPDLDAMETAAARPASITLPVPFDENDDNVSLVVDFSEDETFPEEEFTRVTMSVHHAKMRVFSGEKYVSIDETCVGKPYYGQSVTFTLDDEMFPGYVAGKTYFARYSWVDSQGGFSEWRGFKFTADVVDFEPIRIPLLSSTKVKAETSVSGELHLDYLEGGIQNYTMYDDVTIALENVSNVPFAEALVVNMRRTGGTLTVKRGTVSQTYSADKTYMIAVTNFGALNIIVTETI
ncbi:hypothetical protein [uncultured Victivallis sp.]|uniref:hypothetical protein n=1 Tax=uncultured Victivallis sp. TaxID=354118 RepID=UPI0025CF8545|nr:hypothetical protein [uncultured Victivallis sp.]